MINLYLYQYVKLVTPIYCYHWIFIFHHLLKWLNLLLPLAIHFSPLAQVTQLTVTIGYSFFTSCSSDSMYCSIWPFVFHHLLKWLNLLFPFGHSFFTTCSSNPIYCSIWPFIFHHLLKWLNLLFHLAIHFSPVAPMTQFTVPFGHSFFTICSSDSIYCSHLAIPFSLFAQVSQFTVPIWPFLFHHLLRWLNLLFSFGHSFLPLCSIDNWLNILFHLDILFSPVAQLTQYSVPFGHSFSPISQFSNKFLFN